ncbi:GntR family transcriptional regulator [Desmospora activa]|uniref:GntR family transcriptional regulator n=1 Tax=Desmospora activa DSM 45169 TaxID=1121389 RepID=A0A2T4Z407_9BACL|nr:GntR family transcriptional regulator [Desmospora activa]PTM56596.1 GntR family transcriptional regulator [Desmospora activa DSM 45169]
MNQTVNTPAKSAKEATYQRLLDDILKLEYKPGEKISEKEISEKYEVSRTPVREAFQQLAKEGLLQIYPQKGTVVSMIDLELVEEARFLREQMEIAVLKLACKQFPQEKLAELEMNIKIQKLYLEERDFEKIFELDEAFHRTIFDGCGKLRIWQWIQQINIHFNRIRVLRLAANVHWNDIYKQHCEILEAIQQQKVDQAEKLIRTHLTQVLFDKEELRTKYPHYFKG